MKKTKALACAKVEPPFRVISAKVRFCHLAEITAELVTLFALSNLRTARQHLLARGMPVKGEMGATRASCGQQHRND
jgi:hypothetical protein